MKCKTCKVGVSPKFVAAIKDNACPACGGRLMSDGTYKKIFKVKKQIQDLDFDDDMLFGIAAALATKFTLVPKDLGVENEEDDDADVSLEMDDDEDIPVTRKPPRKIKRMNNVKGMSPQTARRIQQAEEFEAAEDLAHLSPEEEAQIRSEWGMNVTSSENVSVPEKQAGGSVFEEMFASMDGLGGDPDMPAQPLDAHHASADSQGKHAALLARAQQAKNDPTKFKVRRVNR